MLKYINLERKRNHVKPFILAFIIVCIALLGLTYFFAFVSYVKPAEAQSNSVITTYTYVFQMIRLISLASFSIFSSVLLTKFIIEEYKGDAVFLLFTYPVSRTKVFLSKLILCATLTFVFTIVSQFIIHFIFLFTESIAPIMKDVFSWKMLLNYTLESIVLAVQCTIVGILAMQIGFIKKSLPTTIISAVVISIIFCNVLTIGNETVLNIITLICIVVTMVTTLYQIKNINIMKLEGGY